MESILKIGDKVNLPHDCVTNYILIVINSGKAKIRHEDGTELICNLSDLKKAS